jgi:hypothetical protein
VQVHRPIQPPITRRQALAGAAIFALATGLPLPAMAAGETPSPRTAMLLKTVAQIVIPRNDTPGAGDVGVGRFSRWPLPMGWRTRDPVRNPLGLCAMDRCAMICGWNRNCTAAPDATFSR